MRFGETTRRYYAYVFPDDKLRISKFSVICLKGFIEIRIEHFTFSRSVSIAIYHWASDARANITNHVFRKRYARILKNFTIKEFKRQILPYFTYFLEFLNTAYLQAIF